MELTEIGLVWVAAFLGAVLSGIVGMQHFRNARAGHEGPRQPHRKATRKWN